jgi:hypothetical protein
MRTIGGNPNWTVGVSGNPTGRGSAMTAMAREIRRRTGEGDELLNFWFNVFRGAAIPRAVQTKHGPRYKPHVPELRHRMEAAAWLADRGWGKARETLELQGDAKLNRLEIMRHLMDEERHQLRALLATALRRSLNGTDTIVHEPDPSPTLEPPPGLPPEESAREGGPD